IRLYNTLGRAHQQFKPLQAGRVSLYTCGPTVYRYAHVGNLRTYLFADLLRRVLEYNGYVVEQVKNITDVGHLTDDSFDRGEDKMLVGARLEKKTPEEIAAHVTGAFLAGTSSAPRCPWGFSASASTSTPAAPTTSSLTMRPRSPSRRA